MALDLPRPRIYAGNLRHLFLYRKSASSAADNGGYITRYTKLEKLNNGSSVTSIGFAYDSRIHVANMHMTTKSTVMKCVLCIIAIFDVSLSSEDIKSAL